MTADIAQVQVLNDKDTKFAEEAMRRADDAGFLPARLQRPVDWAIVRYWQERAAQPDFAWQAADRNSDGAIVIGPNAEGGVAIHAGQHRILGGLMAHRPVPRHLMTWIAIPDRGRGWQDAPAEFDLAALLATSL